MVWKVRALSPPESLAAFCSLSPQLFCPFVSLKYVIKGNEEKWRKVIVMALLIYTKTCHINNTSQHLWPEVGNIGYFSIYPLRQKNDLVPSLNLKRFSSWTLHPWEKYPLFSMNSLCTVHLLIWVSFPTTAYNHNDHRSVYESLNKLFLQYLQHIWWSRVLWWTASTAAIIRMSTVRCLWNSKYWFGNEVHDSQSSQQFPTDPTLQ